MGQFPAAKKNSYLAPVTLFDKPANMPDLGLQIVFIRLGANFYFLELDLGLFLLGFLLLFLLLILEFTIVHYPAYRRISIRRNLNQVKPHCLSMLQSLGNIHDTKLLPININHPNFFGPDLPIPSSLNRGIYSSFLPF